MKRQRIKIAVLTICLLCALGFVVRRYVVSADMPAPTSGPPVSLVVKEIEGYRNWPKVNPAPMFMHVRTAQACAILVSDKGMPLDQANNPHRNKYFTVFVNEIGKKAMLGQKNPMFPVGSVIVKEKLPAKDSTTPELLTVMIKQAKGFNPASGDWEYMVVDASGTRIEGRGNLENCQECHVSNSDSDYVFRTYLSDEIKSKLK